MRINRSRKKYRSDIGACSRPHQTVVGAVKGVAASAPEADTNHIHSFVMTTA